MPLCNVSRDNNQAEYVTRSVTIDSFVCDTIQTMTKRELGKHYLRQWRKYRGLSLRKLADRMEIEPGVPVMSHANIGRVETFQQPYTQELLEAASTALECSVSDLLTVDPSKEGEVIDLIRLLKNKDPETVKAFLNAIPNIA